MKRSTYAKVKSSTAATMEARRYPAVQRTKPEFLPLKKTQAAQYEMSLYRRSSLPFYKKMDLFAIALMRLWVPTQQNEATNFMPCYEVMETQWGASIQETHLGRDAVAFDRYRSNTIQPMFLQGRSQNLGALRFLNVLMSGRLYGESLGITQSKETRQYFFTQKLHAFWRDYEQKWANHVIPKEPNQPLFRSEPAFRSWWDITLKTQSSSPIVLDELCFMEWFETACRVYATPDVLIQHIAEQILGQDEQAASFLAYVFKKIEHMKVELDTLLAASTNPQDQYLFLTPNEKREPITPSIRNRWIQCLRAYGSDVYVAYVYTIRPYHIAGASVAQHPQLMRTLAIALRQETLLCHHVLMSDGEKLANQLDVSYCFPLEEVDHNTMSDDEELPFVIKPACNQALVEEDSDEDMCILSWSSC